MASQSRDRRVSFWALWTLIRLWTRSGWRLVIFDQMLSLHAQIQEFLSGGGGWVGPGLTARKQPGQRFCCCFLVLNLFYSLQWGSNGFISEKTILFQGSRRSTTFSRVGGPNVNFYREPYNLWFSRGVWTPIPPPLWIRTWSHRWITLPHYMCKLSILLPWICHNGILCSIFLLLSGILDI